MSQWKKVPNFIVRKIKMSDSEYSSTLSDLLKVEENVLAYKTNSQQTREKTVVMIRDEDDLTLAIFELDVWKKSV